MASSSSSASLEEVKKLVEAVLAGDAAEVAKLLDANNGALSPNTVVRKMFIFLLCLFLLLNVEDEDCFSSGLDVLVSHSVRVEPTRSESHILRHNQRLPLKSLCEHL